MEDNSKKTGHLCITFNRSGMTEEEQESFLQDLSNLMGISYEEIKKTAVFNNAEKADTSKENTLSSPADHNFN